MFKLKEYTTATIHCLLVVLILSFLQFLLLKIAFNTPSLFEKFSDPYSSLALVLCSFSLFLDCLIWIICNNNDFEENTVVFFVFTFSIINSFEGFILVLLLDGLNLPNLMFGVIVLVFIILLWKFFFSADETFGMSDIFENLINVKDLNYNSSIKAKLLMVLTEMLIALPIMWWTFSEVIIKNLQSMNLK